MVVCERPFINEGLALRCMQCELCRRYRAKVWTHRIMLEATQHADNSFVTLTYSDENLPEDGSVNPEVTQKWLKRLRKAIEPLKIRYYLVGEYGTRTMRPHYHAALFGFPTCSRGQTELRLERCCAQCDIIKQTWQVGAIQLARIEPASAAYIGGYVVSKLKRGSIGDKHPEFSRMSNRPGIGAHAMHDVADVLLTYDLEEKLEDVPCRLRHGTAMYPLGRYLRGKLRNYIGREDEAPASLMEKYRQEMSELQKEAFENSESFADRVLRETKQKRRNALAKRFKSRDAI